MGKAEEARKKQEQDKLEKKEKKNEGCMQAILKRAFCRCTMRVRDEERVKKERDEVSETKEQMNKPESERNTEQIKGGNEGID